MLKSLSRFTSSFTSSFAALLTEQGGAELDARTEDIRTAMAYQLATVADSPDCAFVWSGIARAMDVQTLWYLRSDLLRVLADNVGEEAARAQVARITEMFRGRVPPQWMAPSGAGPGGRAR